MEGTTTSPSSPKKNSKAKSVRTLLLLGSAQTHTRRESTVNAGQTHGRWIIRCVLRLIRGAAGKGGWTKGGYLHQPAARSHKRWTWVFTHLLDCPVNSLPPVRRYQYHLIIQPDRDTAIEECGVFSLSFHTGCFPSGKKLFTAMKKTKETNPPPQFSS